MKTFKSLKNLIKSSKKNNLYNNISNSFKIECCISKTQRKQFSEESIISYKNFVIGDSKHEPNISPIRSLNIGKNYFRYINPRRRKIVMTLLNSYIKQFDSNESLSNIIKALDLYYNNDYNGKKFNQNSKELEESMDNIDDNFLWHLNMLIVLDRISSQYSRYEYMEYDQHIRTLLDIAKESRNKAKYVFTSHPTQPNSIDQLKSVAEIYKALEENDLDYLDHAMKIMCESNKHRDFSKPSYIQESEIYHSICIPTFIQAVSTLYELGLKTVEDFFETPGTWINFDFDYHPETSTGVMTYTHGLMINITISEYIKLIDEVGVMEQSHFKEIINEFRKVMSYGSKLIEISNQFKNKKIDKIEFFKSLPIINIYAIENHLTKYLKNLSYREDLGPKITETSKKLLSLLEIFKLTGCLGQIRFSANDLIVENNDLSKVKEIIHDILKEISLLNTNGRSADMIIIVDYQSTREYELLQKLLNKYQISNIEIVPLIKKFSSTNDTNSKITMIASSDTRQRDGLLLTELRVLKEYEKNPSKTIYMGQGITAERGGGPANLTHQKYMAMTRVQRIRHIRTVQGYYLSTEFTSKDLIFTFALGTTLYTNIGDHFEPTEDYMDFLFELDNLVGVPQREMQRSKEFNDFYVNNPIIKKLVESFNYAGSKETGIELTNVKATKATVQAYINSDRCSFTHPELAFWDRLDENMIRKISKYYYDNNRHIKYILYNYGFMIKRFDLKFAQKELNFDVNNPIYLNYRNGRNALEKILNDLGLGSNSTQMTQIWNQHLGLLFNSTEEESSQKFDAYRMVYLIQNHFVRKSLLEEEKGLDSSKSNYKLNIMQSALANISPYNGKG